MISAPSGGGKTSVLKGVFACNDARFVYSISATTREPRTGELDGKDYFFLAWEDFQEKIENGEFLEWAVVHGKYYGTLEAQVQKLIDAGKIVFLDIDVQGGLQIKEKCGDDALLIFIQPPSREILEERLRGRKTETDAQIEKRLSAIDFELGHADSYDQSVVNDDLEKATREVVEIVNQYHEKIQN